MVTIGQQKAARTPRPKAENEEVCNPKGKNLTENASLRASVPTLRRRVVGKELSAIGDTASIKAKVRVFYGRCKDSRGKKLRLKMSVG